MISCSHRCRDRSQDQLTLAIQAAATDPRAAEQLLPLLYDELRRLAEVRLAGERPGQTLQATALVHEAYMRLIGPDPDDPATWDGRGHFFAAAAEAMRRILIDRARAKGSVKRGGSARRLRGGGAPGRARGGNHPSREPKDTRSIVMYKWQHARTLLALHRYEDAVAGASAGYEQAAESFGPGGSATVRMIRLLAQCHDQWHEAEPDAGHERAAAEWRARLPPDPAD